MQINGINNNSSLLTNQPKVHHKTFSLTPARQSDTFDISKIGRRLSTNISKTQESEETELYKLLNEPERNMDKAMKKAQSILENMQKLAELAKDNSLTDSDRVEIQVEIEDLRDNLVMLPTDLMTGRTNSRESWDEKFYNDRGITFGENSSFGDGSSIFDRMRERISRGENWNVREVWSPETTTIIHKDKETGEEIYEVKAPGWYTVDDEANVYSRSRSDAPFMETSKKVPTVKETLEAWSPYVVMDAEGAEKTSELLSKQIDFVKTWREDLPEKIAAAQDNAKARDAIMNEAYDFLSKLGGGLENVSLTNSTIASNFLFGDKVYDNFLGRFDFNGLLTFSEDGEEVTPYGSKIELSNDKIIDELPANLKISGLSQNLLSSANSIGEPDNGIYASIPPDAKAIYIEGLNKYRNSL